jgi:hypothetical protein
MKKLTDMRQIFTKNELLNKSEIKLIKGGNTSSSATAMDDKRRERPGGGISTQ